MNGNLLELDRTLVRANKREGKSVLAVSSFEMPEELEEGKAGVIFAERIPAHAVLNVNPYQELKEVIAGGGIVTRLSKKNNLQVLLIFRRGVWDLPKGKREAGESNKECAMREVREELGISDLSLVQSLGATMHGFSQSKFYRVKTTYWYEMRTTAKNFVPQKSEGIEEVKWFKWKKAENIIGYESLKHFLEDVRDIVEL